MSGKRYPIPMGTPPGRCKRCEEIVFWVRTKNLRNVPVNQDGVCHFDTCASARAATPRRGAR